MSDREVWDHLIAVAKGKLAQADKELAEACFERDVLEAIIKVYHDRARQHPSEYGVCTQKDFTRDIERLRPEREKWERSVELLVAARGGRLFHPAGPEGHPQYSPEGVEIRKEGNVDEAIAVVRREIKGRWEAFRDSNP